MRKKEQGKKSPFRRKRQSGDEEEFQIIRDDELFEDVADYEGDPEEDEEFLEREEDDEEPETEAEPDEGDDDSESRIKKQSDKEEEESGSEDGTAEENSELEHSEETEQSVKRRPSDKAKRAEKRRRKKKSETSGREEDLEESIEEGDADGGKLEYTDDLEEGSGTDIADDRTEEDSDEEPEDFEEDELTEMNMEEEEDDEDREPTPAEIALKKHRRRKRILIGVFSFIGVIAAAYLGVSAFFSSHFYYNTNINGADFSLKTVSQVQDYMEGEVAGYSLTLDEQGGKKETIQGTDISLKYVRDDSVDKLLEQQNPFLWVTAFWDKPEIVAAVGVEFDTEKLNGKLGELTCMKPEEQVPSVSAKPEFTGTQFEIKAEEIGSQIDNEKFKAAVSEAISEFLPELNLKEAGCYIPPQYTSESPEVAQARDVMNSYLGANITLDFTPYTEVVDASVISQWISVDENMQVTFNQDAVRSYIAGLAEQYDTYGKPRTFVTGFGNTVQVEGGSYGWQIDQEAEYNALTANIQNGETVTREPNYARRGATHEGNDFGNTYAEVDLTNQHMFYFKDGQCIMQSDIVTGNPNKGHATPQGVYMLAYKATNQVLRGKKMPDGSYEYESPVSYWMPFNGGIGFHDATWQSAFGGDRYYAYGSHGCVNMPVSAAAELFGYIEAGIPVVCHY